MRDDTELIAAVLAGDRSAFNALAQRHKSAVYGLALSFVKDFDTAYDLSQEVFLRAYLRLADLEDPDRFPAWLRAITANTCRTHLRKPREKTGLDDIDLEEKRKYAVRCCPSISSQIEAAGVAWSPAVPCLRPPPVHHRPANRTPDYSRFSDPNQQAPRPVNRRPLLNAPRYQFGYIYRPCSAPGDGGPKAEFAQPDGGLPPRPSP